MWGFVKWLLGGVLSPISNVITGYMDAGVRKKALDVDLAEATLDTDVQFAKMRVEMLKLYQGWWVTRWIMPLIAYPVIAWWICVWADTIFQFPNWDVPAPPEPIYTWTGTIILSFFVVRISEQVMNPMRGVVKDVLTAHFHRRFGAGDK